MPLPNPDPGTLRNAGVRRTTFALDQRGWFTNAAEAEKFRDELTQAWNAVIAPYCSSLRKIGLFANDVGIAASLLLREVDPLELAIIEMLRRFRPALYSLISKNPRVLTGGESPLRGGEYVPDITMKQAEAQFNEELANITEGNLSELEISREILARLFPRFRKFEAGMPRPYPISRTSDPTATDDAKRISNPDMFAAYFRYEMPEAVYSSVELESFFKKFRTAPGESGRNGVFEAELRAMPKGSLKRDDFLRKLSETARSLDLDEAVALAKAAMVAAKDYTYDLFAAFGESGDGRADGYAGRSCETRPDGPTCWPGICGRRWRRGISGSIRTRWDGRP